MVQFHPLADTFPLLEGDEFDGLVKDIEEHGMRHPVVLFEGKILDGRNRYRAAQKLGVAHRETKFEGEYDDAVRLVISENIHRRHLSPADRAIAAESLATALQGRPRTKGPAGTDDGQPSEPEHKTTISEASSLMDASPTMVKRVRTVKRDGIPEVAKAMQAGDITPTAAESIASLPEDEQKKIMESGDRKEIAAKASKVGKARVAATASPVVFLTRQMKGDLLSDFLKTAKDWEDRADAIVDLDAEQVTAFLKELRQVRTAVGKFVTLVEKNTSPSARKAAAKKAAAEAEAKAAAKAPAKKAAPARKTTAGAKTTTSRTKAAPAKKTAAAKPSEGAPATHTGKPAQHSGNVAASPESKAPEAPKA